jgi:hypothetical protein
MEVEQPPYTGAGMVVSIASITSTTLAASTTGHISSADPSFMDMVADARGCTIALSQREVHTGGVAIAGAALRDRPIGARPRHLTRPFLAVPGMARGQGR